MINVQNVDDNECFKWFLVRYLSLADLNPRRITKNDEDCPKTLDFKDIKIQFKIRNIHKIEKKNSITISIFGYENKEKYPIYVSKKSCEKNYFDLLLIGGERKGTMFLSKILIHLYMIIHNTVEETFFSLLFATF